MQLNLHGALRVRLRGRMYSFIGWRSVHSEHCEPLKAGSGMHPMPMLRRSRRLLRW